MKLNNRQSSLIQLLTKSNDFITVKELADSIMMILKTGSHAVNKTLPVDDPHRRCPDIVKAKETFVCWKPNTLLHEGLGKTMRYFLFKIV